MVTSKHYLASLRAVHLERDVVVTCRDCDFRWSESPPTRHLYIRAARHASTADHIVDVETTTRRIYRRRQPGDPGD